jgi:hypothetical protein
MQAIENQRICEKLLGWKISPHGLVLAENDGNARYLKMPNFTTWAEAGLILEALRALGLRVEVHANGFGSQGQWKASVAHRESLGAFDGFGTGPLAIRSAALSYIGSL